MKLQAELLETESFDAFFCILSIIDLCMSWSVDIKRAIEWLDHHFVFNDTTVSCNPFALEPPKQPSLKADTYKAGSDAA